MAAIHTRAMTAAGALERTDRQISRLFSKFTDPIYTLGYCIGGDRHLVEDVVQ